MDHCHRRSSYHHRGIVDRERAPLIEHSVVQTKMLDKTQDNEAVAVEEREKVMAQVQITAREPMLEARD